MKIITPFAALLAAFALIASPVAASTALPLAPVFDCGEDDCDGDSEERTFEEEEEDGESFTIEEEEDGDSESFALEDCEGDDDSQRPALEEQEEAEGDDAGFTLEDHEGDDDDSEQRAFNEAEGDDSDSE